MTVQRSKWDILKTILRAAEEDRGSDVATQECEKWEDEISGQIIHDTYEGLMKLGDKIEADRENRSA